MLLRQRYFSVPILTFCHILLITVSNLLVQYPFTVFGFHTTWGAFSYPAIFILTDLTTRTTSARKARNIIFCSMIPGLLISYFIASYLDGTCYLNTLLTIHPLPLRIALACFIAYLVGQLLDISVFQYYRNHVSWWVAPALSTTLGNLIDTFLFFSIAFYHSTNPFLSQNWPEIAMVDLFFKILISLIAFVPIYGFVLQFFGLKFLNRAVA